MIVYFIENDRIDKPAFVSSTMFMHRMPNVVSTYVRMYVNEYIDLSTPTDVQVGHPFSGVQDKGIYALYLP